jgi:5-formyltetrahydrofolate cyclo-ligase
LRGGFKKLDPHRIPPDKIDEATSLSRGNRWAEEVALADMPVLDAIVCGSVAVTRNGRRCGKGEGYSDLEFAILRELGHPPVPTATTVHDLQISQYSRPCPPVGDHAHHYEITVYAVKVIQLPLDNTASGAAVSSELSSNTLATAKIVGRYERSK